LDACARSAEAVMTDLSTKDKHYLAGLCAAKMAIVEIESAGQTTSQHSVFREINRRLNELINKVLPS